MSNKTQIPIETKIHHNSFPNLMGTIKSYDRELSRPYRIEWDEPSLAASLIENMFELVYLREDEFTVLERKEQSLLQNRQCFMCEGIGFCGRTLCVTCNGCGVLKG